MCIWTNQCTDCTAYIRPARASGNGGIGKLERKAETEIGSGKRKRKVEMVVSWSTAREHIMHAHVQAG